MAFLKFKLTQTTPYKHTHKKGHNRENYKRLVTQSRHVHLSTHSYNMSLLELFSLANNKLTQVKIFFLFIFLRITGALLRLMESLFQH